MTTYTYAVHGTTRDGKTVHPTMIAADSLNKVEGYWRKKYRVSPEIMVSIKQTDISHSQAEIQLP